MKKIFFVISLIITQYISFAQTVTIYRSGLPLSPTYTSLKAAIPNTINGDEVRLSAHTFYEYNDTLRTKITLKGSISGLDSTIIDGKGLGPVLILMPIALTDTQIIQDIIITGGNNPVSTFTYYSGGGIAAFCRLLLKGNVTIRNNICNGSGGGISNIGDLYINGGEGTGSSIIKIHNNKTISPLGQGGGISNESGSVFITGNVEIRNNEAYKGGGMYILRPKLVKCIFDSKSGFITIKDNLAKENGGGIFINSPAAIPGEIGNGSQLRGNIIIEGNQAKGKGGGICNNDSTSFNGTNIQIKNNQADGGGGGIYGGAKTKGGYSIIDNVLISGNTTTLKGGGIYVDYYHEFRISNSQIINNQANGTNAANALHNENKASITNTRIFNPKTSGARQLEVHNNNILTSSQCWWGESDTTGLIYHNSMVTGASFTLSNWVKANWSINNGSPVGTALSYPISSLFTFNTGAALPASSFAMLQGKYTSGSGSFSPAIANNTAANKITSTYTRPSSGSSILWAVVDADSFKSNSEGLSVKSINTEHNTLKVYPNPCLNVILVEGIQEPATIKILGIQGNLLEQRELSITSNFNLNMSQYPQGIYLMLVEYKNGNIDQYKIVKQ